ncbi:MAG: hypothetical protein B7Z37_19580 [Verrucomicrobia bacterium 12-59-8]|nr:MAG: hypothetical protein B7Z37_19580 [Verrucomicrobia bacterium 12-59-8]
MKFSPYRLLLPAAALFAISSCVDPSMGGGYSNNGAGYNRGYNTYSSLPSNYSGSAYYHQGRYYSGGQHQAGNYNYQGRSYSSRYYHNGQYYYGGQHQNHGSSNSNYQRPSSNYQRSSLPSNHHDHDHGHSNTHSNGYPQNQGPNWLSTQPQQRYR